MYKNLFVFLLALLSFAGAPAQVDLRFGPEISYLQTRFPSEYSFFDGTYREGSERQTLGFEGGFGGRCLLKEHWQVSSGLQYQLSQEHGQRITHTFTETYTASSEYQLKTTFQKIAIPILLGYSIPIGQVRFSINTGLRVGFMVKGNSRIDGQTHYSNAPSESTHADFDHFYHYPQGRWTLQWMGAIGAEFGSQLYLGIQLAKGNDFSIDLSEQFPYRYKNLDGLITLAWRPFHLTR